MKIILTLTFQEEKSVEFQAGILVNFFCLKRKESRPVTRALETSQFHLRRMRILYKNMGERNQKFYY